MAELRLDARNAIQQPSEEALEDVLTDMQSLRDQVRWITAEQLRRRRKVNASSDAEQPDGDRDEGRHRAAFFHFSRRQAGAGPVDARMMSSASHNSCSGSSPDPSSVR